MKYLIVGKSVVAGTIENDSGKMHEYFELGWETVGSRFDVIALYNQGLIDEENVTLVTTEDRMFFYTSFFKNVISWNEFCSCARHLTGMEDWTENHMSLGFCQPGFVKDGKYSRYKEDGELIFNGWDLEGAINPQEPFLVLSIRKRAWCDNRNSDMSLYTDIVKRFKHKLPIYVVGRGAEDFCDLHQINYVERLQDYVSLLKNKNCASLISQATGTVAVAMTCAETDIHMIDPSGAGNIRGTNAVLGGTPVHFFTEQLYTYTMNNWRDKSDSEYYLLLERIREKIEKMCKEPVDK